MRAKEAVAKIAESEEYRLLVQIVDECFQKCENGKFLSEFFKHHEGRLAFKAVAILIKNAVRELVQTNLKAARLINSKLNDRRIVGCLIKSFDEEVKNQLPIYWQLYDILKVAERLIQKSNLS